jgi:zinc protease
LLARSAGSDAEWRAVGEKLAAIHRGPCEAWDGTEERLLALLKQHQPRYLAIIGKPTAFKAATVRAINRATRMADDDPWTDCRWGLITGATPAEAMGVVTTREPLVIERALTTTGINLGLVDSALTISDGGKGGFTIKKSGENPENGNWSVQEQPGGTVGMFADFWNHSNPQLLVTSSHATQFNLEMPFGLGLIASYGGKFHVLTMQQRDEFAKFLGGAMFTGDVKQLGAWIKSTNAPTLATDDATSRVWLACGNCLIGDARGTRNSMVATALGKAGFRQFLGYVVPSWYGRGGWGTSSLWQGSGGRLSLAEAFFLNTQGILDETITRFPGAEKINFDSDDIQAGLRSDRAFIQGLNGLIPKLKVEEKDHKDLLGLIHDRDVLALWGDPLWEARFDAKRNPHPLKSSWRDTQDGLALTLTAGSDYEGGYPLWLPKRLKSPALSGANPPDALVADDFLLIRKVSLKQGETMEIKLTSGA